MLRCMGPTYIHHSFLKVSYGMDKRRCGCHLEHPKIPFCCINHVTKSCNITARANAAAILTPTNHMAIRCLLVTCPFKKKNGIIFISSYPVYTPFCMPSQISKVPTVNCIQYTNCQIVHP